MIPLVTIIEHYESSFHKKILDKIIAWPFKSYLCDKALPHGTLR